MFCVYALLDPYDGAIRYIGATANLQQRMGAHNCRRYFPDSRLPDRLAQWIRGLPKGVKPGVRVMAQDLERADALELEQRLIHQHINDGCDLLNKKIECRVALEHIEGDEVLYRRIKLPSGAHRYEKICTLGEIETKLKERIPQTF